MNLTDNFENLFNNFIRKPGAERQAALQACVMLNLNPPSDYLDVLQFTNGGEGFIQQSYFRLYSWEELLSFHEAYQVKLFAPDLVIFGSNGGGEAFAFDTRQQSVMIVQIPFIPLDFQYARPLGRNFLEFLHALAEMDHGDGSMPQIDISAVGKEVYEIQPIVFGGSPTDHENKALVPSQDHAELSVFWNSIYQRMIHDGENN